MNFSSSLPPEPSEPGGLAVRLRQLTAVDYGYAALLTLSFCSTLFGVLEFAAQGGREVAGVSLFFCVTLIAVLTATMGFCGSVAFGASPIRMSRTLRVMCAGFYGLAAYMSLLFAFAFWWGQLGARDATDAQVTREVARVESGLTTTRSQFDSVAQQMDALARAARSQADVERSRGNTCGTQSQGIVGPRSLLRGRHADFFSRVSQEVARRVTNLKTTLDEGSVRVRQLRAEAANGPDRVEKLTEVRNELTRLSTVGSGFAADPTITALTAEMTRIREGYRTTNGHTDVNGARITCIDQSIATSLEGAINSLRGLATVAPPQFEIYEGSRATTEAMARLSATTLRPFGLTAAEAGLQGWNDYVPFGFALIVDGLILLIAIYRGRRARHADPVAEAEAAIAERGLEREAQRRLVEDEAAFHSGAMDALANAGTPSCADLLIEHDGRQYVVIPTSAPDQAIAELATSYLRMLGVLERLRLGVRERISYSRGLFRWRRDRCARRLLAALGTRSAAWARGSTFRWFQISPKGLLALANWVTAVGTTSHPVGEGPTITGTHPPDRAEEAITPPFATLTYAGGGTATPE